MKSCQCLQVEEATGRHGACTCPAAWGVQLCGTWCHTPTEAKCSCTRLDTFMFRKYVRRGSMVLSNTARGIHHRKHTHTHTHHHHHHRADVTTNTSVWRHVYVHTLAKNINNWWLHNVQSQRKKGCAKIFLSWTVVALQLNLLFCASTAWHFLLMQHHWNCLLGTSGHHLFHLINRNGEKKKLETIGKARQTTTTGTSLHVREHGKFFDC